MTAGGKNLIILGIVSVAAAFATTGISLAWYHNSGDIYLDRSRPGYLPDEQEIEDDPIEEDYSLERSGPITKPILDDYLNAYRTELEAIDAYQDPFTANALSDSRLGIPAE